MKGTWLPNAVSGANFRTGFTVELGKPANARRCSLEHLSPPPVVGHVALAEEFQNLLDTGEVCSQAELAERFELTRARVTQLLNLLSLAPEVIAFVRALPPGTPARQVTERGLRRLTGLPLDRQVARAKACLPGFAVFLTSSVEPATARGVERAAKRCSGQQR